MSVDESGRHGVVLSGGGAYGAYEVGVMKALFRGESPATEYQPLQAQIFTGTSIGALNSSIMVAHGGGGHVAAVEALESIWRDRLANSDSSCGNGVYRIRGLPNVLDVNCLAQPFKLVSDFARDTGSLFSATGRRTANFFRSDDESLTRRFLEQFDIREFFNAEPFFQTVEELVPLDSVAASPLKLRVVATNFDRGEVRVFDEQEIAGNSAVGHKAILASAAVPSVFSPVEIESDYYIDGGALMNTPIFPAVHEANSLHVIYLDPDVSQIPVETLETTIGVLDRLLITSWAFAMNQDIERIGDFNRSLALIESADRDPNAADPAFVPLLELARMLRGQVGGSSQYSQTTIHRYHPREDLGGMLGFLDLDLERIDGLIEAGYLDAINHDCEESGCIFAATGQTASATAGASASAGAMPG